MDSGESCDYSACSHLIKFMRCINHHSLTFIEEAMVWSCGLGDGSRDKCCYLFGARMNAVWGRVGKKWKKLDRAPQIGCWVAPAVNGLRVEDGWPGWQLRAVASVASNFQFSSLSLRCWIPQVFQFDCSGLGKLSFTVGLHRTHTSVVLIHSS